MSASILLTGCGNENSTITKVPNTDNNSSMASSNEEKEDTSSFVSEPDTESDSLSSVISSIADNSSSNADKERPELFKSDYRSSTSSKSSGGGNPSKPAEPEKPTKPTKPAEHTHNWEKWPKGMTTDWSGEQSGSPPDENGYTDNKDVAEDKNGKKVALNMCAKCYAFFGRPDTDEWWGRYWDHCKNVHDTGYSTYSVYAIYDVYYCEGCGHFKRGAFSFYGYLDYSNGGAGWIYLTPGQIEELNLKKL